MIRWFSLCTVVLILSLQVIPKTPMISAANPLEKFLVNDKHAPDEADWEEVMTRWGWVLLGQPLPPDALMRTQNRSTSSRTSKVGVGPFSTDTGPLMRIISLITLQLNTQVVAGESILALRAKISNNPDNEDLVRVRRFY